MKHLLTATIVATSLTAFADVPPPIDPRPLPTTPIVRRAFPPGALTSANLRSVLLYGVFVGSLLVFPRGIFRKPGRI